jgi:cytochrome P450
MSWRELRMSVGALAYLEAHAGSAAGVLRLRSRPKPKMLVWHPEAIDWIFRFDQRMHHPGSRSLTPLFGRRSLLWADGPRHAAYRQLLGPPLRGRRLAAYRGIIASIVHAAIDELAPGSEVALAVWTRRLALRIVARIVLGRADEEPMAAFTAWIDRALGARHRTLAYRYLAGGLPESSTELDRTLVGTAKSTVDMAPAPLSALMLSGAGPLGPVDDIELRDAIVSLLFAGHETTASAAAWTLYWLDRDPRIRQEVVAELTGTPDGSDAARVPLLQAVISETLRLAPPVTVAGNRTLTEDAELLGRPLAAGATLTPSIYLAHHHPGRFPNPGRFDPDRFLGGRVPSAHYFPFGGGSRYCLGSQLAQLELRMITAAVLSRVRWRCVNPGAAVPRLRGHAMAPDSRLLMSVRSCRG